METVSIEQLQHALRVQRLVAVEFMSSTCAPCRTVAPVVQQLGQHVHLLVVNIDAMATYLTSKYRVRSVPTVALFKDGVEVSRLEGVFTLQQAVQKFSPWLGR